MGLISRFIMRTLEQRVENGQKQLEHMQKKNNGYRRQKKVDIREPNRDLLVALDKSVPETGRLYRNSGVGAESIEPRAHLGDKFEPEMKTLRRAGYAKRVGGSNKSPWFRLTPEGRKLAREIRQRRRQANKADSNT